jgi:mannosyl-3-phosphoglycerate phosphatase
MLNHASRIFDILIILIEQNIILLYQSNRVVFTDIDGTLVDINTGEYGKNATKLIELLKERNIPLILASAKTRLEQNRIREDLDLSDPYIVENGGAVVIPKGYFSGSALRGIKYPLRVTKELENDSAYTKDEKRRGLNNSGLGTSNHDSRLHPIEKTSEVILVELGESADNIRKKLSYTRRKYDLNFKGVADLSLEEICNLVSVSKEQARRMAKRNYGETILQIQNEDFSRFIECVKAEGMQVIYGGRFFDVTIGTDKGLAVGLLKRLFNKRFHDNVTFFGIGDSPNDVPMLSLMDVPILVQRTNRSWLNYEEMIMKNETDGVGIDTNRIIRIKGIGPNGWQNAIHKIILELN